MNGRGKNNFMSSQKHDIFADNKTTQKAICLKYGAQFTPTDLDLFIAISDNADGKTYPIHGLRLPQEGHRSGWFIWAGDDFSDDADFFKLIHGKHLEERCPEVMQFLGLPQGFRFVIDDEGNMKAHFDPEVIDN